ncbi:hypothetical protein M9458_051000, partial [Cirrhinus mrigala]
GFLLQVNLFIKMQPQLFTSDDAKVAFLLSLLTVQLQENSLHRLQQGTSSVNHYTLHFRTLAAASGWNEKALLGAYRQGLNHDLRAAMALYDDSIELEAFLQRTTKVCQPPITAPQPASVAACHPVPEPMQIDSSHLSRAERNRRIVNGLCLYCGQPGHHLRQCSIRPPRPVVSTLSTEVEISSLTLLPVTLHTSNISVFLRCSISENHWGVGKYDTLHPSPCKLVCFIMRTSNFCIILGRPWLQQHQPELSWDPDCCNQRCLIKVPRPSADPLILSSTRIEIPDQAFVPEVPAEYMAFQDVFSKQAATQLPPHWPWDCAIDLLPGAQLPKGRVYPLSIPERQAMEEYISEALAQGFIQPSTSPAASGFFFVGKKDGGSFNNPIRSLCFVEPNAYNLICIRAGDEWKTAFVTPTGHYEYRVMPYGLSISPSVFQMFMNEVFREFLHRFVIVYIDHLDLLPEHGRTSPPQHRLYLKLEKCEFHRPSVHFLGYIISAEGVQMDQGKISVIQEWPQPLTVKELQRFLGFANFYRRFIKDYSTITAPLTSLLRGKPKTISWNPSAHEAFLHLKKIFSTAPLLHHPDPELPFTVEVDASTTGAGAVLSQAVGEPPLLHPCAFSRKLSPAEQNYDVGNRELLAIKLALEEWRHWLEGSKHPFTIITDHKNLQYNREAKRLNPRQARWALFFTRFDYKITYRPGSKNISADALSRLHSTEQPVEPEPIVPSNLIISPIVWELDEDIAAPPECPEGKIFVPLALRQNLLDTAHRQRTLSLLQSRYWWPSMRRDTIRYVQSCSVCAMSISPRQLPTGKLVPLPIPQRPWSHIRVDCNTCILVMVDRFSKMCKFFPLKGLPTAMETAETLFQHLFRHFGLPEEIVSDRGPQFISCMEGFLQITEKDPGARTLPPGILSHGPTLLEQVPPMYAQNSLRQDTTGLTPFRCVLGYQPPLFPWMEEPSNVPAVDHWFRESESVGLSSSPSATGCTTKALCRRPTETGPRIPTRGPGVAVYTGSPPPPRYIGPFKILRRINDVTFQLQLPPRYRIHPTFHVSLLKPCYPSATEQPGAEVEPPPPEILEPPSIYTVHEILGSRRRGGRLEYLIDWEGYGPEERSWVSQDDILDPTLLSDFHRDHPDQPAPRGRGRREPPLEEGVVSGIHHCHLHLTHTR